MFLMKKEIKKVMEKNQEGQVWEKYAKINWNLSQIGKDIGTGASQALGGQVLGGVENWLSKLFHPKSQQQTPSYVGGVHPGNYAGMDPQQIMAMYQQMQQQQQAPQQMATQQFQTFGATVKALEGLGFDKETLKQVIDAMA